MDGISKRSKLIIVLLCTIGGILILVGSTYAFFNYFRRGEVNNRFITGSISIDFIDGEFIKLTDQFPTSDKKARFIGDPEINPINTGDVSIASFVVKGIASDTLSYYVYAIYDQDDPVYSGTEYRLEDSEIKIYLESSFPATYTSSILPNAGINTNIYTGSGAYQTTEFGAYGYTASYLLSDCVKEDIFDDGPGVCTDTKNGGQIKLAEGSFAGGTEINHYYTMHMWIAGDVTLSDVDPDATYCASHQYCMYTSGATAKKVFSDMFYTVKLKVTSDK